MFTLNSHWNCICIQFRIVSFYTTFIIIQTFQLKLYLFQIVMFETLISIILLKISSSIILTTFENQMLLVKLVLAPQTMQNVHYFATHVILALISLTVPIVTTGTLSLIHAIPGSVMHVVLNMPNSLQPRLPILIDTLYLLFPKNLETGSDRIVLDSIYCLLLQETPFPFLPINLLPINSKRKSFLIPTIYSKIFLFVMSLA